MPIKVDVRVMAATTLDLAALSSNESHETRFSPELFLLLNVLPLHLPPLRERKEDIAVLLEFFIRQAQASAFVDPDALETLCSYRWPGNVRELENLVQRAFVMHAKPAAGESTRLLLEDFCLQLNVADKELPRDEARRREVEQIRAVLISHGGNCARAARELNIPRTTLVSRAKKFNLL